MTKRLCLITTEYKGVFYAMLDPDKDVEQLPDGKLNIRNAEQFREVVYWSFTFNGETGELAGFARLASHGPTSSCRISPPVAKCAWLPAVTSVLICDAAAEKALNEYVFKDK